MFVLPLNNIYLNICSVVFRC